MKGYFIYTWDAQLEQFTPQDEVSAGPYPLFGLRLPIRLLRALGYSARRQDPSVLIVAEALKPK